MTKILLRTWLAVLCLFPLPVLSAELVWTNGFFSPIGFLDMYNGSTYAPPDPAYTNPIARRTFDANNYTHAEARYTTTPNSLKVSAISEIAWNSFFFTQPNSYVGGWINSNFYGEFTVTGSSAVEATVTVDGTFGPPSPTGPFYVVVIDTLPLEPGSRSCWPTANGCYDHWGWLMQNSLTSGQTFTFQPGVTYYIYAYSAQDVVISDYVDPYAMFSVDSTTLGELGTLGWTVDVDVTFEFAGIPTSYSVTAIEPTYSTYVFSPTGINDSGKVVGFALGRNSPGKSFEWTQATGRTIAAYYHTQYRDINNNGDIGGTISSSMQQYSPSLLAASGVFYSYGNIGYVNGLNDTGSAVVEYSGTSGQYYGIWDYTTDLRTNLTFRPAKINNNNQVAGTGLIAGSYQAVMYDPAAGELPLGTLGGTTSSAADINENGTVVGMSTSATGDCIYGCAFIYDSAAGMTALPKLSTSSASASAVNNGGFIVGSARDANQTPRAVIWYNNAVVDLNTLIPPNSGWVLQTAVDINEAGQIVGVGTYNGAYKIFVLTP